MTLKRAKFSLAEQIELHGARVRQKFVCLSLYFKTFRWVLTDTWAMPNQPKDAVLEFQDVFVSPSININKDSLIQNLFLEQGRYSRAIPPPCDPG